MRLAKLTLRGITSFTQPVVIDLDSLGEGLVAVVGDNGAGKTTLLESVFASLFKGFPSRPGSLYRIASGRDAFIESEWVDDNEHRIKVRLQIDAEKRATESYIFVDVVSATTGRAKEFEAEVQTLRVP